MLPAEENIGVRLHQALAGYDAPAGVLVLALPDKSLEHGWLRLLDLQEQGIVEVDAEEEHDPGASADAAHPDDLAGHVDEAELLEQMAAVGLQSAPVGAEQSVDFVHDLVAFRRGWNELVDRHDQRGVADDPPLAVDHVGQLLEGVHAVLGARLGDVGLPLLQLLGVDPAGELLERLFDRQARVPDIEVAHAGENGDRLPVGAHGVEHDLAPLLVREAELAAADREARRQALYVPLPRARRRLVEVVDVEDQAPLR